MGLLSHRRSTREKAARRIREGKALIIPSAEGVRYFGSALRSPAERTEVVPPTQVIDERAAQAAATSVNSLVRVELADELAEGMSCFEEIGLDGKVVGRIWVRREPIEPEV